MSAEVKNPEKDLNMETGFLGDDSGMERSEAEYPWIVFALDGTEYGINSKYVLSIEIVGEITPIVDAQHHCPGITRSRGNMIELLDLRALFGVGDYLSAKSDSHDDRYMMVVIETEGIKRGVIVDQIVSVEYITRFEDGVVDKTEGALSSRYVSRVARREKSDSTVLIFNADILSELS
ncbi:MAG: chemotaxis protein CheW [Oscillospiraceae bacterium]|nr:chemotaxis protein CheW [Oscillospiraceae bacterium]